MKILTLISILALAGCSVQFTPEVISKHKNICINNGTIKEFTLTTHITKNYVEEIKCTNGAIFKLKWNGDIYDDTKTSR